MRANLACFGLLAAAGALMPACATQNWQMLESEGFSCHVEEGINPELVQILAAWTHEDMPEIAALIGQPIPLRPLDIYCGTPTQEGGLVRTLNGEVGRYVATHDGEGRIELVAHAEPTALRSTLRHELVHHLVQEEDYAEWLNEGLAEYTAYKMAESPTNDDLHHLLHSGPVLGAWRGGLRAEMRDGSKPVLKVRSWLPSLPQLLRMDYEDYQEEVLGGSETLRPEFHSMGHLLVRVLLKHGGADAPAEYTALVGHGADPWDAYRLLTGLADEDAVIAALSERLDTAVKNHPHGSGVLRTFLHSQCMRETLSDQPEYRTWNARSLQAYPDGPLITFKL